ncbi:MAG: hypothetical protein KJ886_02755 [Candidatus Thermoplasmatota archaeon]|nr:hypothetical protein [Candidatus Thermoplasmatota archaeon]MCG2826155.1 hypothetical protein [Thermoplasmatales archaeon]
MNKKHIGIIVSGIVIMATLTGCVMSSGCLDWFAGEWTNGYRYLFHIDTTDELNNVTLYIPALMVKGEIASIVKDINNDSSKPSDWVCEYIDTEHGKMLKISADTISAGYHSIWITLHNVDHTINTEKPVGNEPVFYPRFNETNNKFQTYLYTKYNTSQITTVEIYLFTKGSKHRTRVGIAPVEEGRSYDEQIEKELTGEQHNWYIVDGDFTIKR